MYMWIQRSKTPSIKLYLLSFVFGENEKAIIYPNQNITLEAEVL